MLETKQCSKCKSIKAVTEFNKSRDSKLGVRGDCKVCHKLKCDEIIRTKKGLCATLYKTQKHSSKLRGQRPPDYTKEELRSWLYSQTMFHTLYSEWKNSGYQTLLRPSIDRLNEDTHYCFSNIRLMTWGQNKTLGYSGVKVGTSKKNTLIPVDQYTKRGEFMATHESIAIASRETGACGTSISAVCKGNRKTAGKFKWEFRL